MFCNSCGKQLSENAAFCPECGKKIDKHESVAQTYTPVTPAEENGANGGTAVITAMQGETPKASKERAVPQIDKNKVINVSFLCGIFLIWSLISFAFIYAINYGKSIEINTLFDDRVSKYVGLSEIVKYMYDGCSGYSPTGFSTMLSVSVYVMMYSLPAISLIMFIGMITGSSKNTWHTAMTILTVIYTAVLGAIMPLTLRFVPHIKNILAVEYSIIAEDIGAVSYIPIFVFVGIIVALIVVSHILLFFLQRRMKNEKI